MAFSYDVDLTEKNNKMLQALDKYYRSHPAHFHYM